MREELRSAGLVEREGLWRDPSDTIGAVASPVGIFVGWIDVVWAGPAYCEPRLRDVVHVPTVDIDSDLAPVLARAEARFAGAPNLPLLRPSPRTRLHAFARRLPGVRAWRRLLIAAIALCALGAPATAAAAPAQVRDYNLGRVELADPSPFGSLPIRLWGALGVPTGPGPHPLVVVGHGRHGTGCPSGEADSETWPCFSREQRNDLGLRHVVAALARRGIAAIAPDLNGAYTGGWGEPNDRRRWPRIVNRTLAAVAREAAGARRDSRSR